MTKTAYSYDENTRELKGSIPLSLDVVRSQREGKKYYLLPANSTLQEPLATAQNKTNVFNGTRWELVSDYRNQYVTNADFEITKIKKLGDIKDGLILITAEQKAQIEADADYYVIEDGALVVNPNYEQIKAQKETERVARLTMTALDFIGVLQQTGLTLVQINEYLESHLDLKMQLTYCQNVYCGVVQQLCPLSLEKEDGTTVTITKQVVINAFKAKHGELITQQV